MTQKKITEGSTGGPVKVTGVTGMDRDGDNTTLPEGHPWGTEGAQKLLQKEEAGMIERMERKKKTIETRKPR